MQDWKEEGVETEGWALGTNTGAEDCGVLVHNTGALLNMEQVAKVFGHQEQAVGSGEQGVGNWRGGHVEKKWARDPRESV